MRPCTLPYSDRLLVVDAVLIHPPLLPSAFRFALRAVAEDAGQVSVQDILERLSPIHRPLPRYDCLCRRMRDELHMLVDDHEGKVEVVKVLLEKVCVVELA